MDAYSDLSFFTLVIKLGTLAAAAQQMGVTPPSVSKRLASLEARLGVRLLHRTTRRISLTPEGEIYVSEVGKPEGKPLTTGHTDFKPSWSKTGEMLVCFRRKGKA